MYVDRVLFWLYIASAMLAAWLLGVFVHKVNVPGCAIMIYAIVVNMRLAHRLEKGRT